MIVDSDTLINKTYVVFATDLMFTTTHTYNNNKLEFTCISRQEKKSFALKCEHKP